MTDAGECIVVRVAGARWAVPMSAVVEVGAPRTPTRVPGLPDWLPGVVTWRGRVLALVDLGRLLATPVVPATRVVVLRDGAVDIGLLCDEVVTTLELTTILPVPSTVTAPASDLLAGQLVDADGPIGLLDVAGLVRLRERLPSREPT